MKRGFTLSEMLILIVAILIIGATVAFFLDIFKKQASDSKRVTEIKQIARGLEEYYDHILRGKETIQKKGWGAIKYFLDSEK